MTEPAARVNPFQQPVEDAPTPRAPSVLLAVGMALAYNAITVLGVVAVGWPAGNVYVLFWVENAVLGFVTIPRIATARGTGPAPRLTVNGRSVRSSPGLLAGFFCLHYGIFCVVHAVFTGIVAYAVGIEATWWLLGMPAVLIIIRYAVETALVWFGPNGQRWSTSAADAMMQPYPRIVVLHVAVLLALLGSGTFGGDNVVHRALDQVVRLLPPTWQEPGVVAVVLLLVVKTVVDVITTARFARR